MFADNFLWGVASSSYQVEGAKDTRGDSIWDAFCRARGKVFEKHTGDVACDQVGKLEEDLDLMAALGVKGYRFSIAWPRIQPSGRGKANPEGLAYYERLVDGLLARGIQPWATLYHWDLPLDLYHAGGWMNPDIPGWFSEYTGIVSDALSDRVANWMTLNEPQVFLGLGMVSGVHAPGMKMSREDALLATHHAMIAHGDAVSTIRARTKQPAQIGWAPVGETHYPASDKPEDIEAARTSSWLVQDNEWYYHNLAWYCDAVLKGAYPEQGLEVFGKDAPKFTASEMDRMCQPLDFFGVNVYRGRPVESDGKGGWRDATRQTGYAHTHFHWPVTPDILYWAPKFIHERYGLPIYVTENGLASMDWVHSDGTVDDGGRVDFLSRYLGRLRDAAADGVDVRGYFQWSIMDNFEWAEGYRMRFGLIYVDFETLERIPKRSYHWYKDTIAANGTNLPADRAALR